MPTISHLTANIFQGVYTQFLLKMSHLERIYSFFCKSVPPHKKKKTIPGQLTGNGFLQNGNSDQLSRESVLILQQRIILTMGSLLRIGNNSGGILRSLTHSKRKKAETVPSAFKSQKRILRGFNLPSEVISAPKISPSITANRLIFSRASKGKSMPLTLGFM